MAVDTRDKRGSVINYLIRSLLPNPDGSLNQGDRQQVGLVYRGINASGAAPSNSLIPILLRYSGSLGR